MRRDFVDVLKTSSIDFEDEYVKLSYLFNTKDISMDYGRVLSLRDIVDLNFTLVPFRGTCLNLDEFNEKYNFHFDYPPEDLCIDFLISYCEYLLNLLEGIRPLYEKKYLRSKVDYFCLLQEQIFRLTQLVGFKHLVKDKLIVFVPFSSASFSAAEILPDDLALKTIFYNHHSLKGKIEEKKAILLKYASYLEPLRSKLHNLNSSFADDLFYLFNNLNIRHNNCNPNSKKHFKAFVAALKNEEIENWYDEIYQMCLLAVLMLDHIERKNKIDDLKSTFKLLS